MHSQQILPPLPPLSGTPAGQISTCSATPTERILPPPPGGVTPTERILPHSGGDDSRWAILAALDGCCRANLAIPGASAGQTPTRLATSTGRIPPCPSAFARRILPCSMAPARRILPRDSSRCENLATFCGKRFDGHSRQPPCGAGCSSLCAKT